VSGLPEDPAAFVDAVNARDETRRRTLSSASGDTIVADWESEDEQGVEYWRFDAAGGVYEHQVFAQQRVEPVESPLERLRNAAAYPLSALALLREKRRR
jgi:hypothetical protein